MTLFTPQLTPTTLFFNNNQQFITGRKITNNSEQYDIRIFQFPNFFISKSNQQSPYATKKGFHQQDIIQQQKINQNLESKGGRFFQDKQKKAINTNKKLQSEKLLKDKILKLQQILQSQILRKKKAKKHSKKKKKLKKYNPKQQSKDQKLQSEEREYEETAINDNKQVEIQQTQFLSPNKCEAYSSQKEINKKQDNAEEKSKKLKQYIRKYKRKNGQEDQAARTSNWSQKALPFCQFPWGFNQQKIYQKNSLTQTVPSNKKSPTYKSKSPEYIKLNDVQRREQLGLQFLNHMKSTARSKLLNQAKQKLLKSTKETKAPKVQKATTNRNTQQNFSSVRKTTVHSFMQQKNSQLQQSLYLQLFDAFQKRERIRQNLEQLKYHTNQQRITSASKSVLGKIKKSIKLFNEEIKNQDQGKDICIYPEFISRYFRWIIDEYEKVKFNQEAFQEQEYLAIIQEYEKIIQNNSITHPERVIRSMNVQDKTVKKSIDKEAVIERNELIEKYILIKEEFLQKFKQSQKDINELIRITPSNENQIKEQIKVLEEKLQEQSQISLSLKKIINGISDEILQGNNQQVMLKLKQVKNELQESLFEINSQNQAIKNQLNLCKQIQLSYQVNHNKESNQESQNNNSSSSSSNNNNNIAPPLQLKVQEYVEENEKKVRHNLEQEEILKLKQTSENEEFTEENLEQNFEILNSIVVSIQKSWRGYACRKQLTEKLSQNALILETIATLIQKVWRGYRTRKLLRQYLEMLIQDQEIEEKSEEQTTTIKKQIDNNQNQNKQQQQIKESEIVFNRNEENCSEKEFQVESAEDNFEILNNIVIMIQKIWRGYSCRKLLQQYLEELLQNQEENQNDYDDEQDDQETEINQDYQENLNNQPNLNDQDYQQNNNEENDMNEVIDPDNFILSHQQVESEEISLTEIQQYQQQQNEFPKEEFKFKDKLEEENEKLLKAISKNTSKVQQLEQSEHQQDSDDLPADYYQQTPCKKNEILQLSQLRAAIGSEQLLRQFQSQSMSSSWSFPLKKLCLLSQLKAQKSLDEQQQLQYPLEVYQQTLFGKQPFEQFTSGLVNSYIQNAKLFKTYNQDCERAFQSQLLTKPNKNEEIPILAMSVNDRQLLRYSLEKWVEPKTPQKKTKVLQEAKTSNNQKQLLTVSLIEAYLKPTLRDMNLSCKISQIRQMTQSSEEGQQQQQQGSQDQSPFILNQKFFQKSVEIKEVENIKIVDRLQFVEDQEEQQPLQVNTEESINLKTISDLDNQILVEDNNNNNYHTISKEQEEKLKKQERKERKGQFLAAEIAQELLTEFCQDIYQNQLYQCLREQISIHDILKSNRKHFQLLTSELIQNYLELLGQQIISTEYINNFYQSINLGYDHDMQQKLFLLLQQRFEQKQGSGRLIVTPPEVLNQEFFEIMQNRINEINSPMLQLSDLNQQLLFSCANEFLEYFRPFDLRGCPLVWKINLKKLTFSSINPENIEIVLNQVFNKLIQASFTQMGVLEENYDEEIYGQEISTTRKQKMEESIQADMEEDEEKWTTYDDEESIVGLEIADLVFNQLIQEMASEMMVKSEEKKNYQKEIDSRNEKK